MLTPHTYTLRPSGILLTQTVVFWEKKEDRSQKSMTLEFQNFSHLFCLRLCESASDNLRNLSDVFVVPITQRTEYFEKVSNT